MPPPAKFAQNLSSIYRGTQMVMHLGARVQEHLKPIHSVHPDYDILLRGGGVNHGFPAVDNLMILRLATVVAQAAAGNGSSKDELFKGLERIPKPAKDFLSLGEFMRLNPQQQLGVIDQAWEKVCKKKAYNKYHHEMYEPDDTKVFANTQPLPSGMIPDGKGSYRAGHVPNGLPNAFRSLGIGFRVDGSGDACQQNIDRVWNEGMTTQLKNRWLMQTVRGWQVDGTVVDLDTSAPRVWRIKKDLFNESAVCVSRNLFGATAFPTREFDGEAVLWAVDVSGLSGFDTEQYQKSLDGNKQWRPGEKAFELIPSHKVIGYVRFQRMAGPDTGGWKFQIPQGTTWTYNADAWRGAFGSSWAPPPLNALTRMVGARTRSDDVRDYINAQLAAWSGPVHTIGGEYDFA